MKWEDIKDYRLRKSGGEITEYKLPQLQDALLACRDKVLVSLDKVEDIIPEMYAMVKALGMVHQVTFKTKIQNFPNPESLKQLFPSVQDQYGIITMFTPTIFAETFEADPDGTIQQMKNFMDAGCPGFEMIYFKNDDKMLTYPVTLGGKTYKNVLEWLKAENKRVIQFPEWPENQAGNWYPAIYKYRNIDLTGKDLRCDWEWLTLPEHAPNLIISDRLEVLLQYLEVKGKRNLK